MEIEMKMSEKDACEFLKWRESMRVGEREKGIGAQEEKKEEKEESVNMRGVRRRKSYKSRFGQGFKHWTEEDDKAIVSAFEGNPGLSKHYIAKHLSRLLNRSPRAIARRHIFISRGKE